MSKVKDISGRYKNRTYEIGNCAGCGKEIKQGELYTQVVLPVGDSDTDVKHIALCGKCKRTADSYGVF